MNKLDDEVLMAFADGELEPAQRDCVAARIGADPELRARLAVFLDTGRPLTNLFAHKVAEDVPEHLIALVRDFHPDGQEQALPRERPPFIHRLRSHLEDLFGSWQLAAAGAAAASIVLFAVGSFVSGGSTSSQTRPIVATGPVTATSSLGRMLQAQVSGVDVPMPDNEQWQFRSDLSFRNKDGRHCRRFVVAQGTASDAVAAIACRSPSVGWSVVTTAQTQVRMKNEGALKTVSEVERSRAIEATLDQIMPDDAYGADEEKRLIARDWQ